MAIWQSHCLFFFAPTFLLLFVHPQPPLSVSVRFNLLVPSLPLLVKEKLLAVEAGFKHTGRPNLNKTWHLEKFDCILKKGDYYVHSAVKGKDNWVDSAAGQGRGGRKEGMCGWMGRRSGWLRVPSTWVIFLFFLIYAHVWICCCQLFHQNDSIFFSVWMNKLYVVNVLMTFKWCMQSLKCERK